MVILFFSFVIMLKKHNYFQEKLEIKYVIEMNLLDKNSFQFCWIVDFPMFEIR